MKTIVQSISFLILFGVSQIHANLYFNTKDLTLLVNETAKLTLYFIEDAPEDALLTLSTNHPDILTTNASGLIVKNSSNYQKWAIELFAHNAGHDELTVESFSKNINTNDAFVRVTVQHSKEFALISVIVGWIYFTAWSISFYPQIYENWTRKSVVGLNFDFISLNLIGFILYSMFNIGLWIPEVDNEYLERNPRGHNPVQLNDIFFSVHAVFATLVTVIQCFCYERGSQQVSYTAKLIMFFYSIVIIGLSIVIYLQKITWLDFLYYCSYIKLSITLIKYIPQAIMNYKRQSTIGWSIGNIFLDFTGGTLSIMQMIINAYNYNDWASIFGDPTKFGLGLLSVFFDILFFLQHYVFYSYQLLFKKKAIINQQ
ncbi:cystinosin homolog isoform X2 [Daktulosphaira vitifoliae]|uniref:cystinosin homolog isoform X2 n=1 Tax=Daktulosphaira vitifoliae TaxID=58002 RepID=UPI0021A996DB|nr:cystinosin homolog isoform X2 [Daktulosphaira vitifoliae]XP_050546960.1 cystinosin homolog isoform X2 [Daktulosphaira vitifoliae]